MGDAERMEAKVIPAAGYLWEAVRTVPMHRPIISFQNFLNAFKCAPSRTALEFKPVKLISKFN